MENSGEGRIRFPVLAINITAALEKAASNFPNNWKPQEHKSMCCKKRAGPVERKEGVCFTSVSVIACPCADRREN